MFDNHPSRRTVLAGSAALAAMSMASARAAAPYATVRKLSPKLDAVIAPDAVSTTLYSQVKWAEGPVWDKKLDCLFFSDPPANIMRRWSRKDGTQVFLEPSGYSGPDLPKFREPGSNGLAIDAAGDIVIADSGMRAITRLNIATKKKTVIVDRYKGKRFNSPNDLVIAKSGAIYFTDPPYGLNGVEKSPDREMKFCGMYHLSPSGKLTLLDGTLNFPNGVQLSPDEKVLYLSNSDPDLPIIRAFDLAADGMPTGSRLFFDAKPMLKPGLQGIPDGMEMDAFGHLFCAGPGGMMILSPGGELLGLIAAADGSPIANCAFGEDGRTLFLTSNHTLAAIRTRTRGLMWA